MKPDKPELNDWKIFVCLYQNAKRVREINLLTICLQYNFYPNVHTLMI